MAVATICISVLTAIFVTVGTTIVNNRCQDMREERERGRERQLDLDSSRLIIRRDRNPRQVRAIFNDLLRRNILVRNEARDGPAGPSYDVANGLYKIHYKYRQIGRRLYIEVTDEQIILSYNSPSRLPNLREYLEEVYERYNRPDNVIMMYSSRDGTWSNFIPRRPRNMKLCKLTPDMNVVLQNIERFKNSESQYSECGLPYRMGYLLEGPSGTGKTTMIEVVASRFNMSVYLVSLNSTDMTDERLVNMISSVPPNSIIVFEEIEKQITTLQNNTSATISYGGILTALDGPQRLSHGTIVIMTANSIGELDDTLMVPMLRRGRIDHHFNLQRSFTG